MSQSVYRSCSGSPFSHWGSCPVWSNNISCCSKHRKNIQILYHTITKKLSVYIESCYLCHLPYPSEIKADEKSSIWLLYHHYMRLSSCFPIGTHFHTVFVANHQQQNIFMENGFNRSSSNSSKNQVLSTKFIEYGKVYQVLLMYSTCFLKLLWVTVFLSVLWQTN